MSCFLCAYADHGCDIASVEGTLLRFVAADPRGSGRRAPAILLACGDGREARIILPEHAQSLVQALIALPAEAARRLQVRVFHLMRSTAQPPQPDASTDEPSPRTMRLQTTPASALIIEPDLLLNITDINNAEYCVRQYPLRRMAPSTPTEATLRGTIIHGAFKEMLKGGHSGVTAEQLARTIDAHSTDLALRQLSVAQMAADVEPHLDALGAWYAQERNTLWRSTPQFRAETFLLAPEVGLKGRLDFLMQDERGGALLELKTGGAHAALPKRDHRWQVYGYQTLLAARRPGDQQRPGATLLYSGTPQHAEGYGIPFALRELHRVLEMRNRLALVHVTGHVPAPPGGTKCGRCSNRSACLRASRLLSWEQPEVEDDEQTVVTPEDVTWFGTMYGLLRLEARAAEEQSQALWRLSATERCANGSALGDLIVLGEPCQTQSGEWEYTFRCANTSELREGDQILLSDGDPVHGDVVSGTILRLHEHGVVVWTPERIAHPTLIDRYDSDIVHQRTVQNLWRWLDASPRLRALVAGTRAPTFGEPLPLDHLPPQVNKEQREAISRGLAANDFLLVQGPPGTGKTTVVAQIAERAIARGERVLLAAFTNQAVDNVLLRLRANGYDDFVRLGHELSIAPELHRHRLAERARAQQTQGAAESDAQAARPNDPTKLRDILRTAPLVATTTATWSAERYDDTGEALAFDLAIIDEASQLTVPALLGALRFARRFVLVGDERQLPPLVVSEAAAAGGLRRSLFAELLERWGATATVALRRQYRMHPTICAFSSDEFYQGQLVTAGAACSATLALELDRADPMAATLAPEHPLVFVDVPRATPSASHGSKASVPQALIVRSLVLALLRAGVPASDIGVVAPYRAQVAAVRQRLAARGVTDVLVDTVDRFQGGERQVILFSFGGRVESASGARGTDFLADPNRLNVALTRAQRKLILVGDRQWLERTPLLARLTRYCAQLYGGHGGMISARVGGD